jgi:maltose/moltooligosaccharide transporter
VQATPVEAEGDEQRIRSAPDSILNQENEPYIRPLSISQMLFYGAGGIAGGLVFTMMNNALPLYLQSYTMPAELPEFFAPGRAVPAQIVALLTNERSLFGGLVQPLIGALSDRTHSPIGKRSPFILAGGIGTGVSVALLGLQPPFWWMLFLVTLAGISLFVALGPYVALLADITPPRQRGRVGGLIALAGVVGAVFFTTLSALLWDTSRGWVFVTTGVGVIVSLVLVSFGVHEPPSNVGTTAGDREADKSSVVNRAREMIAHRPLTLYTVSMGVYWLGAGAAAPFITRFATEELKVSQSASLGMVLVLVLATAVGAVISGALADRIGHKAVLGPGLVLFAVAAIVASQVRDLSFALPIMILVGLGNSVPTALHLPLLADLVPKAGAGALMGLASMVWSVAQPVGSYMAGLLVDNTGSYRGVFIFAGICMLASFAILRSVKVPEAELKE